MKKTILSLLAGTLFVGVCEQASADPFKGKYMGGRAGYANNKFPVKGANTTLKQNTFAFGGFAGMMSVLPNNIFFAGQVEGDASIKSQFKSGTPGVTGKIGYRMAERFVLALTLGAVYSFYQFQPDPAIKATSKSAWGYRPGTELLFAINENNLIGFSYMYTKNLKIRIKKPPLGPSTVKPSGNLVMAQYIYKF